MKKHMNIDYLRTLNFREFIAFMETLSLGELENMPAVTPIPIMQDYSKESDYEH